MPLEFEWAEPPLRSGFDPDGRLEITAGPLTHLFIDPASHQAPVLVINAPRLVAPVAGDFQCAAHVTVQHQSTFDAGVPIALVDDVTWGSSASSCPRRATR